MTKAYKGLLGATAVAFMASCGGNTAQTEQQPTPPTVASLEKLWETDTVLKVCESVLYDAQRDVIYVSNIDGMPDQKDGKGYISRLSTKGEILALNWISGLDAPKGMGISGNTLYVTNITEVVAINIENAAIEKRYPVEGAKFLNDIAVAADGSVYISDSFGNSIVRIKDGNVEKWLESEELNKPNGLFAEPNRLLMASWGGGKMVSIDWNTKAITTLTEGIGAGDGLEAVGNNQYVVSSWDGQVFFYGDSLVKMLDTTADTVQSADIGYHSKDTAVLVPTFFKNKVVAYKLKK